MAIFLCLPRIEANRPPTGDSEWGAAAAALSCPFSLVTESYSGRQAH